MDRQSRLIISNHSSFLAASLRSFLLTAVMSLLAISAGSGFCDRSFAQESIDFPYQALVSTDGASVRSGPGAVHYATQTLKQGDSVEVYRHDLDSWCAIRPLDNSFSLVPESTLKMVREGVAEVVVDDARAWVGTHHGAVSKPLWQIKLRKGELVSVIGEISYPDPAGHSTIWFQIQPPPGEFRWIHQSDLKGLVSELPTQARRRSQPRIASSQVAEAEVAAPPRPDLNTRDDRVIGTGLRRVPREDAIVNRNQNRTQNRNYQEPAAQIDTQIRAASNMNESQRAIDQNVRSAEFETSNAAPEVALASATQDLVLPQNQDGVNEGWRPVTRPIGQRVSGSATAFNSATPNAKPDLGTSQWDQISKNQNGSASNGQANFSQGNNGYQSPVGSFAGLQDAPVRVADSMASDRSMAASLNLARNMPVTQTYTNMPRSVAAIEARLTNEMLKAPSEWQLNDLQQLAGMLQQSAASAGDRDNAVRLMNKIQNCQRLKTQFTGAAGSGMAGANSTNAGFKGFSNASQLNGQADTDSKFDASGWLNELKRQQGSLQSTYVLQDDTGKITHHIQPTPGLNLARYLKTKIGVVGKRGYHQELKLDHVLVSRVYGL